MISNVQRFELKSDQKRCRETIEGLSHYQVRQQAVAEGWTVKQPDCECGHLTGEDLCPTHKQPLNHNTDTAVIP